jgi:hypothetical protein
MVDAAIVNVRRKKTRAKPKAAAPIATDSLPSETLQVRGFTRLVFNWLGQPRPVHWDQCGRGGMVDARDLSD